MEWTTVLNVIGLIALGYIIYVLVNVQILQGSDFFNLNGTFYLNLCKYYNLEYINKNNNIVNKLTECEQKIVDISNKLIESETTPETTPETTSETTSETTTETTPETKVEGFSSNLSGGVDYTPLFIQKDTPTQKYTSRIINPNILINNRIYNPKPNKHFS